jgi:hypothetical protein
VTCLQVTTHCGAGISSEIVGRVILVKLAPARFENESGFGQGLKGPGRWLQVIGNRADAVEREYGPRLVELGM